MLKILIFFIFSLIMLKISWFDIETAPQSSSGLTNKCEESGHYFTFQGLKILLRSWYCVFMTLRHSFFSETHGRKFYRFFAFEFIFLILLVNLGEWIKNPFTVFRMITWVILLSSFVVAGYGIHHLLQNGIPQSGEKVETTNSIVTTIYQYVRNPKMLLEMEKTTILVTTGIYKYIRHPLYSALIIMSAVTLLKNDFPWLPLFCLFLVATTFLYATALIEEKENLLKFGPDYAVYITRTNMFFPFLS